MPETQSQTAPRRDIYSVSRLNSEVRAVLEGSFPLLWVEGEISNLARPASGHIYFSLKDPHAQVRCAMFRMKRQLLRFQPENGMQVLIRARVGLYEPRGEFQLIAEHMEPSGEGALQRAFEELKQRLDREGLFDTALKKPLPPIPRRIGVITSPSGAAIRDVLSVLKRRFPAIPVVLYPTQVQGAEAPQEIAEMIRLADRRRECDLLILTRGGGSLEDLMAFNDEGVARAIHGLEIPIISAVGHEIDFTIADFVADRRAPTPSAAAELAVPDREELSARVGNLSRRLQTVAAQQQQLHSSGLTTLQRRLERLHPGLQLEQRQQRLDELALRLVREPKSRLQHGALQLQHLQSRLAAHAPLQRLRQMEHRTAELRHRLIQTGNHRLHQQQQRMTAAVRTLQALSPLATLERGYSITLRQPDGAVIHTASEVKKGDRLETRLHKGRIISRVESAEE